MKKEDLSVRQRLKNKLFILIPIAVCVIVLAGLLGFSIRENNNISAKLKKQQEQYEQIKDEKEILSRNYEDLQVDYANLKSELTYYEDQEDTIQELESKVQKLEKSSAADTAEKTEKNEDDNIVINNTTKESKDSNSEEDSYGTMVWLSETGTKYHSYSSCGNMNPAKARQVSESSAKAQGYQPCKKCW